MKKHPTQANKLIYRAIHSSQWRIARRIKEKELALKINSFLT
jgi:hypothetical protein